MIVCDAENVMSGIFNADVRDLVMQRRMPAIITVFCGTNTFCFSYIVQDILCQFTKDVAA